MPNLLVRDLPDDIHAALQQRAERQGQSLQQFLTAELRRLARRPSVNEVLDRIERRHGGHVGLAQAAEDLGEDRGTALIVIDASILANVIGDDGDDGHRARQEFRSTDSVAAPDLVDVETTAVLRKRWLTGGITDQRFADAITDLEDLDFDRYPTLQFMTRAYHLRAKVTVYDAAYVALAEELGCELLTADARLAQAPGPRCAIRVLR